MEIEKEIKALEKILYAIPKLTEFQKGRLYGIAERMQEEEEEKRKKEKQTA